VGYTPAFVPQPSPPCWQRAMARAQSMAGTMFDGGGAKVIPPACLVVALGGIQVGALRGGGVGVGTGVGGKSRAVPYSSAISPDPDEPVNGKVAPAEKAERWAGAAAGATDFRECSEVVARAAKARRNRAGMVRAGIVEIVPPMSGGRARRGRVVT
jgi:hypothetical protein